MKHKLFLLGSLLLVCGSMMGQTSVRQTLTINGQVINKTVTNISFNGDNVLLQYSDGTEDEEDMEIVTLSFNYSEPTGIGDAPRLNDKGEMINDGSTLSTGSGTGSPQVYDLQGRKVNAQCTMPNAQLKKGIYILNGKKVVIK